MATNHRILSIDAWADDEEGWTWNEWFRVGQISAEHLANLDTDADLIDYMIDAGYLAPIAREVCDIDDDGYNLVFCERDDMRPIFAIEYGNEA